MKTTAYVETRSLRSIDQAGNGSAKASPGRADATRHHVLVQMQPVSLWVQRSGCAAVVVVEAAEHGEGDDPSRRRRLHLRRQGNALVDALMRSGVIEVAGVFSDHFGQMALAEDEHVVETLSP